MASSKQLPSSFSFNQSVPSMPSNAYALPMATAAAAAAASAAAAQQIIESFYPTNPLIGNPSKENCRPSMSSLVGATSLQSSPIRPGGRSATASPQQAMSATQGQCLLTPEMAQYPSQMQTISTTSTAVHAQTPSPAQSHSDSSQSAAAEPQKPRGRRTRARSPALVQKLKKNRRLKANDRERNRMHSLNKALEKLRGALPVTTGNEELPNGSKLTKIETLRFAHNYIWALSEMLQLIDSQQMSAEPSEALSRCAAMAAAAVSSGTNPSGLRLDESNNTTSGSSRSQSVPSSGSYLEFDMQSSGSVSSSCSGSTSLSTSEVTTMTAATSPAMPNPSNSARLPTQSSVAMQMSSIAFNQNLATMSQQHHQQQQQALMSGQSMCFDPFRSLHMMTGPEDTDEDDLLLFGSPSSIDHCRSPSSLPPTVVPNITYAHHANHHLPAQMMLNQF
jgi:hypothetical protein